MPDSSQSNAGQIEPPVPQPDVRRRRFLLAFGAGAAGAVATVPALAITAAAVAPDEPKPDARGYRETDHIRAYYATARR
ncbi:MAG: hypothetical protein ACREX6_04145 [Casimicrobiaceae bacterium]